MKDFEKMKWFELNSTTWNSKDLPILLCQIHLIKSVSQFSLSVMSDSLQPHGLHHSRLPCPTPSPAACSNTCPLSLWCHPPSFPAFKFFQHQGLFQWLSSFHQVAKVLEFQHQHFQWIFRTDFLKVWSTCKQRDSQESSPTSQYKSINSMVLIFLYITAFTSIHDYWKNHSFDKMDLCWQKKKCLFFLINYLGLS